LGSADPLGVLAFNFIPPLVHKGLLIKQTEGSIDICTGWANANKQSVPVDVSPVFPFS